jgi:hypothetical protein
MGGLGVSCSGCRLGCFAWAWCGPDWQRAGLDVGWPGNRLKMGWSGCGLGWIWVVLGVVKADVCWAGCRRAGCRRAGCRRAGCTVGGLGVGGLGVGGLIVGQVMFGLIVCWLYWMWAVLGMGWAGCEPGWVRLVGMWAGLGVDCIVSSCTQKVYVIVH